MCFFFFYPTLLCKSQLPVLCSQKELLLALTFTPISRTQYFCLFGRIGSFWLYISFMPHLPGDDFFFFCSQNKKRRLPGGCMLSSYPYCFGIERNQLENCKEPDNAAIFCCPILILLHKWLWRDSWILPSALARHVTHTQLHSAGSCPPLLPTTGGKKISYNLGSKASNKKKKKRIHRFRQPPMKLINSQWSGGKDLPLKLFTSHC